MRKLYISKNKYFILFMFLKSTGFEYFTKIMGGIYAFGFSVHISFNPTSYLNQYLTDTYMIIPYLTNPNQYSGLQKLGACL